MALKPVTLAIFSDTHCGSTVAVCPPKIELDDGGFYGASKAQRWLWQCFNAFLDKADAKRRAHKGHLYTVCNGDLTEGAHHHTTQILTGNPTAQSRVVDAIMEPVLALKPDKMFFVRGTAAHVGPSAAYEERVALGLWKNKNPIQRPIDADIDESDAKSERPKEPVCSWWSLPMEIQGVRLSFAHHGRMGQRPWTKHNIALLLAKQIFMEHAERGRPHPHIAVRSHMHQFADTFTSCPTRLIQTPAWQLHTEYTWKVVPESLADIGGVLITIDAGQYEIEPILFTPEPTKAWHAPS